jgi:hypothetical protein
MAGCSQAYPCLTIGYVMNLWGNVSFYILECAYTTGSINFGSNFISFSATTENNPTASIAWNSTTSQSALFVVSNGSLTVKFVGFFNFIL